MRIGASESFFGEQQDVVRRQWSLPCQARERSGSPKKAAPGGFCPKAPASALRFLPLCAAASGCEPRLEAGAFDSERARLELISMTLGTFVPPSIDNVARQQLLGIKIYMRILLISALASTLVMGGCATITRGSSQTWVVESEPSGAEVKLSTGQTCVTPCSLNLKRKTPFTAELIKPGFEPKTAPVASGMDGKGTLALVGNVIFGGIIGIGVDLATGATNGLTPNPLKIDLQASGETSVEPAMSDAQN